MLGKVLYFLSFLFFAVNLANPANARDLESNVVVLFDFSNSYYTPERAKSEIPNNVKKLANVKNSIINEK